MEKGTRVPQVAGLEEAVRMYYERIELSTGDIRVLFACSQPTATRLKAIAKKKMDEDNVPCWNARNVNTEAAYAAWGLEIESLEKRLKRLRQLKMAQA